MTVRTLIVGSCVARDTFTFLPRETYSLSLYLARQSLISSFTPPVSLVEPAEMKSPFQQRLARADFASSLPDDLERLAGTIDLILWDLTDERMGVYLLPDGSVVTRTVDLVAAGHEEEVRRHGTLLPFGTDRHFTRWAAATDSFLTQVTRHHPQALLVLVGLPWAPRTVQGSSTPSSFGLTARRANVLYGRYLNAAAADPRVRVVGRELADVLADETHQWGSAPFHYSDRVYRSVLAEAGLVGD